MPNNHAATSIIRNMILKNADNRPKMKTVVTKIHAILKNELHRAAEDGDVELVMGIIRQGVDIDATDESGRTALDIAADNDHAYMAEKLLEEGADAYSADEDGSSLLCWAAENGHTKLVKLLLEADVDVDAYNEAYEATALKVAADSGRANVVKMLLNAGADAHQFETADLHELWYNNHEDVYHMLLQAQSDI